MLRTLLASAAGDQAQPNQHEIRLMGGPLEVMCRSASRVKIAACAGEVVAKSAEGIESVSSRLRERGLRCARVVEAFRLGDYRSNPTFTRRNQC